MEIFHGIDKAQGNCCVIRLKTSSWKDKRGIHIKRSLTYLRRECRGFNILEEDADQVDANFVVSRIINLHECVDGIYSVITCNESHDRESGLIDDYDYKLITRDKTQ